MALQTAEVRKAAFLVENGFSEADYVDAASILEKDGWFTRIISPAKQSLKAWNAGEWGGVYAVMGGLEDLTAGDYSLLIVPGGRRSIEKLKLAPNLHAVLNGFINTKRPLIIYNRALELLLGEQDFLVGRKVSGPASLAEDIRDAGAQWTKASATVSGDLLTLASSKPSFSKEIRGFLKKLTVHETTRGPDLQSRVGRSNKAA